MLKHPLALELVFVRMHLPEGFFALVIGGVSNARLFKITVKEYYVLYNIIHICLCINLLSQSFTLHFLQF
jgi:hypothetical protein